MVAFYKSESTGEIERWTKKEDEGLKKKREKKDREDDVNVVACSQR